MPYYSNTNYSNFIFTQPRSSDPDPYTSEEIGKIYKKANNARGINYYKRIDEFITLIATIQDGIPARIQKEIRSVEIQRYASIDLCGGEIKSISNRYTGFDIKLESEEAKKFLDEINNPNAEIKDLDVKISTPKL